MQNQRHPTTINIKQFQLKPTNSKHINKQPKSSQNTKTSLQHNLITKTQYPTNQQIQSNSKYHKQLTTKNVTHNPENKTTQTL